jgi:hypothetical protein
MIANIIAFSRYIVMLLFPAVLAVSFAGMARTRKNIFVFGCFTVYEGDANLESKEEDIQSVFEDAVFDTGFGKKPNPKIVFPIKEPTNAVFSDFGAEAFKRFSLTKDKVEF